MYAKKVGNKAYSIHVSILRNLTFIYCHMCPDLRTEQMVDVFRVIILKIFSR